MSVELEPLPFDVSDLEPYISASTVDFHYNKHHKGYVDTLNKLIAESPYYNRLSLNDIYLEASKNYELDKKIYNNAGQAINHQFYWNCMIGEGPEIPSHDFNSVLEDAFGSFESFKGEFNKKAAELFGSGWVWLVKTPTGHLRIDALDNAGNPLVETCIPLLCCDVWEHAYYLDYQNKRKNYVENFWSVVNWDFVEANYERGEVWSPARAAKYYPSIDKTTGYPF